MEEMEGQQTPTAGTPIYQESQAKNAKWLWLLVILIIIAALVFAFVRGIGPFGQFSLNKEEASPSPVSQFSPEPVSSASPEASVDKSQASVRVLNGTGKAGVAASFKDFIEGKGWKVGAIGNAANEGFEETVIRFKESFKKFEDALVKDLSDDYSVEVSTDGLEASDSADIEIIVGTK